MFDSDPRLSEQLEDELKHNLLLIFKQLKITPESDVNLRQAISAIDSIEADSGNSLLGDKDNTCLRQFAKKNPEYRYNFEEFRDLFSKLSFEETFEYDQSQIFATPRSHDRRASVLSERIRACPLPDFSTSSSSINFTRPASPSQSIFSRSFSSASGRLSPFLRRERSSPELENIPNRPTRAKSFRLSSTNAYRCSSPIGGEPLDLTNEPDFNDPLEGIGFDKNTKNKFGHQVRRVNGELNRKLEEAEDIMSKLSNEASQRISRAESELRSTKLELSQKKKTLFDLRSEVRVQVEQIDNLEKEKKDLQSDLMNYKKLYFQTKKQFESTKSQKSQIMVTNKSQLEELEETLKNYQASHLEHQDLITRCNTMTKTISNLEKDVAIAQSVAKNFDELVQENFQLKENIESLQKSLAETYQPQSTSCLDFSQGNRLNTELSGSNFSVPEENSLGQTQNSGGLFPLRHETTATSRQLKELEKENRYLKRHIDKTWGQWDRVKGDLVDLINYGFNDAVGVSQQRLGSILLRMDRYRPAKAYPTFKRASIQQVLIDDRPALSSNENSSFASPALCHMASLDLNSSNISSNTSSITTPTTLKMVISGSTTPNTTSESQEQEEIPAKISEDTLTEINNLKAFTVKSDVQSEYTDQFLENLASTPTSLKSFTAMQPLCELSGSSIDTSLSETVDSRSKLNSSSNMSTQSYLARRALKKSGPRVIKKVSFSGLYENENGATTRESVDSSFILSSQLNSPPLPLPNAIEAVSEPPTRPPLDNLLKIGEVPSFDTITRLNEIALKAYSSTHDNTIKSPKSVKIAPPRPKESKSYVLLIVYAVAACIFTFWTSPTKEPLLMDTASLRDEEEKEKDNILENVTRRSNSQPSSNQGYEVRLNQNAESSQGGITQVNYRDNSNVFLKFWVEMLLLGGAFPSD